MRERERVGERERVRERERDTHRERKIQADFRTEENWASSLGSCHVRKGPAEERRRGS